MIPSLLIAVSAAISCASAFEVNFPNAGDNGYWVTKHTNILNWKANSTDPSEFSVAILNADQNALIGNFQVANTVNTSSGTFNIRLDKIPSGTYSLLFVNSSNYQLEHPQVYYTSDSFQIKPNGTAPVKVTANSSADPDADESPSADGASPDSDGTTSSASSSSASDKAASASGSNAQAAASSNSGAGASAAASLVGLFSVALLASVVVV